MDRLRLLTLINRVAGVLLGVAIAIGLALLVQRAIDRSGSSEALSFRGVEFSAVGLLSLMAFVALIFVLVSRHHLPDRRAERDFTRAYRRTGGAGSTAVGKTPRDRKKS